MERLLALALAAGVACLVGESQAALAYSRPDWDFVLTLPDDWQVVPPSEAESAEQVLSQLGVIRSARLLDSLGGAMFARQTPAGGWSFPYMTVLEGPGSGNASADYEAYREALRADDYRAQLRAQIPPEYMAIKAIDEQRARKAVLVVMETPPLALSGLGLESPFTTVLAYKMLGSCVVAIGFHSDAYAKDEKVLAEILDGVQATRVVSARPVESRTGTRGGSLLARLAVAAAAAVTIAIAGWVWSLVTKAAKRRRRSNVKAPPGDSGEA